METKKFAWWPVKVTSGILVWLESYYVHKNLYDSSTGRPPINGLYFIWTESSYERILRILQGK